MRVAVTYENGQVFQHFGRTEKFKIYDIEDEKVISSIVIGTNGRGHGALTDVLLENQIDVLICGGIGGGAQVALQQAGIQFYGGVSGDTDEIIEAFINHELLFDSNVHCNHHGNHHCGQHGCKHHDEK